MSIIMSFPVAISTVLSIWPFFDSKNEGLISAGQTFCTLMVVTLGLIKILEIDHIFGISEGALFAILMMLPVFYLINKIRQSSRLTSDLQIISQKVTAMIEIPMQSDSDILKRIVSILPLRFAKARDKGPATLP